MRTNTLNIKKSFTSALFLIVFSSAFGQLSGIKTIPGDYSTLQSAVADLNLQGVGSVGVTFNIAAGHTESITAPIIITATGTADKPVVFQKSGSGIDPSISRTDVGSYSTSAFGGQGDAVIIIEGPDFLSFDGIDAGNIQWGEHAFSVSGTGIDVGADEYKGLPAETCQAPNPGNTLANSTVICDGESSVLSLQFPTPGTGVIYQWQSSATGTVYTDIPGATDSVISVTPGTTSYYQCMVTCQNGPVSGTSNPVMITVHPLPVAIITVDHDTVCAGDQIAISIALTGSGPWLLHGLTMITTGGSTYVLPDALVSSSPHIINVNPFQSASYHIETYTDTTTGCTNDTAAWVTVVVKPAPYVELGNDTTICPDQSLLLDAGNTGATFLWSPGGETTQTIIADTSGYGTGTVQYMVEVISNSCSSSDSVTITFDICSGGLYAIGGKTKYAAKANAGNPVPNPPSYNPVIYNIDQVIVILKTPGGAEISRDTSDALGKYLFTNVANGSYILSYDKYTMDTMQWGNDVNAIDLALIKYYIGSDTLNDPSRNFYPKYRKSANVDNNAGINAIDISRIKAKVGSPYNVSKNFPKGNWVALDTAVTVAGADLNINLKTICYGDYNASSIKYRDSLVHWSGNKSMPAEIIVTSDEYITTSDPTYFEVPLRMSSKMNEFSALGLELNYANNDYKLVSVSMPNTDNKNGFVKINPTLEEIMADDNDLLVTDENGVIRVVFATTNHFDVAANDEIIRLGFRPLTDPGQGEIAFRLSGTGVMGNQYGEENEDVYLVMPKIFVQGSNTEAGFEFAGYPNPFSGETTLTYSIPAKGTVKLNVYNAIGELVSEVLNETQLNGKYVVPFSASNLPAGMYTFKLEYTGVDKSQCLILKLVH